ncbi:MAG: filamentous hemagglutinin N-terminal domain-containing protein [Oscillatoria sp. SIO1A7]|nr:filamentous hemagglutinin N-terminal domain-containing protein [Oscillatoria sp. SIO1A7]
MSQQISQQDVSPLRYQTGRQNKHLLGRLVSWGSGTGNFPAKKPWNWLLALGLVLPFQWYIGSTSARAQVLPDATLQNNSLVNFDGTTFQIEGGTEAGTNLFHSFEEFSLNSGQTAFFNNAAAIENILARVTGGRISNIEGLIRANGTANLFLLNPAGIVFGPGASLDIGGSFVGSTADGINLSDGSSFSAINPEAPPLLTINVPIGLQYGASPGSIEVRQAELGVNTGRSLMLVGGEVSLNEARVRSQNGRIKLGSLQGVGTVELNGFDSLSFPAEVARGNISLSQSVIDAVGDGTGSIAINALNFDMASSDVRAGTEPNIGNVDADPGNIEVNATETISLSGNSRINNDLAVGSIGAGGNITLEADFLTVNDSQISVNTSSEGDAGSLTVRTASGIDIVGGPEQARAGLFSSNLQDSTGNGGTVTVETGQLTLRDGGLIGADVTGMGDGGSVTIRARETVEASGTSPSGTGAGISSSVNRGGSGDGGSVTIQTPELIITDRSRIATNTFGSGNGGTITIDTNRLTITGLSQISADTVGSGDGGTVTIRATETVQIIGDTTPEAQGDMPPEMQGDMPPEMQGDMPPEMQGDMPPEMQGDMPPEMQGDMPPEMQGDMPPEMQGDMPPEMQGDMPPEMQGDMPPEMQGDMPPEMQGDMPPEMQGDMPPEMQGDMPPEMQGDMPPEMQGDMPPEMQGDMPPEMQGDMPPEMQGDMPPEMQGDMPPEMQGDMPPEMPGDTMMPSSLTGIFSTAQTGSTGNGGSVTVSAPELTVTDGGQIASNTSGTGNGGTVTLEIDRLAVRDSVVAADTFLAGNGGGIVVRATETVEVSRSDTNNNSNLGGLSAAVRQGATGNGGNIDLSAPEVTLNNTQIGTVTLSTGNAGDIKITTDRLSVANGGFIAADTFAEGDGGTVEVSATERIEVFGTSAQTGDGGGIFSAVRQEGMGNGGSVMLSAPDIIVRDDAGITSETSNTGNAGDVIIESDRLTLSGGGQILANSSGAGDGGTVTVTATERVEISGRSPERNDSSGLFSSVSRPEATGTGGSVTVMTPELEMSDRGVISTSTFGTGDAGRVIIESDRLSLSGGARIDANTSGAGMGGNVTVTARETVAISGQSATDNSTTGLFSNVRDQATGNGGRVTVTVPELTLSDTGQIASSTSGIGDAGQVTVEVDRLTASSGGRISANTSGEGEGGTVEVRARETVEIIGNNEEAQSLGGLFSGVRMGDTGNGGSVLVIAPEVTLDGDNVAIASETFGSGDAGEVSIRTERLRVLNGARIEANTRNSGVGGTVEVSATETVEIIGFSQRAEGGNTGIFSDVRDEGTGNGGSVILVAPEITIDNNAQIASETFASGNAGEVTVETARLRVGGGARIAANTSGAGNGGEVTVSATETIELVGRSSEGNAGSGIFSSALESSTGLRGGSVTVTAPDLILSDGGEIASDTFSSGKGGEVTVTSDRLTASNGGSISANASGAGDGGNVSIRATEKVELTGTGSGQGQTASGIFSSVGRDATGRGGTVTVITPELSLDDSAEISTNTGGAGDGGTASITTNNLTVLGGARVAAETRSSGQAGEITIEATDSILLNGWATDTGRTSALTTDVEPGATGNGGSINVETQRLSVTDGASIEASTAGVGSGGTITIRAAEVEFIGSSPGGTGTNGQGTLSALRSGVEQGGTGDGGSLILESDRLVLKDGGTIDAGTLGAGNAGSAEINATSAIEIGSDNLDELPSSLVARVGENARGNGGNLTVETNRLTLRNGSQISTATLGAGSGGDLSVRATERIELNGSTPSSNDDSFVTDSSGTRFPSGLFASAPGANNAGNLTIRTGELLIEDGAEISVSSQQIGEAGSLTFVGDRIFLDNGSITAQTVEGSQGNIFLTAPDIQLRRLSRISTNATGEATGGNITIDTEFLAAKGNSDITANAQQSFGGRVILNASGIFGIVFRQQATGRSDITATSQLGASFGGVVEINTPDADPTSGLVSLNQNIVDAASLVGKDICSQGKGSEFTITGRGGLPPNPADPLDGSASIVEWATREPSQSENEIQGKKDSANSPEQSETITQIVEAQGWIVRPDGSVELVAYPATGTSQSLWHQDANCHTSN